MIIGMVAAFQAPYGGNFIAQQLKLCQKFKDMGHDIVMIFPEGAKEKKWCKELIAKGWHLRFLPSYEHKIKQLWKLIRIIKDEKIDILHSIFSNYQNSSALASLLCGIKCVIHIRSEYHNKNFLRKVIRKMKITILFSQTYLIAISKQTLLDFIDFGMKTEKTTIIEDGVSYNRLEEGLSREVVRKKIGIGYNSYLFIMMGYDIQIKGVDIALEAFNSIYESDQNANINLGVVVATGMGRVKSYVKERFEVIPPWLYLLPPIENIGEYYRAADYFISASRTEGFPNAVMEAFFMKLPVIVSNIPGTKWAQRFETSTVFETENATALVKCINELIDQSPDFQALNNTKELTLAQYGLDKWAKRIIDFYKQQKIIN